MPNLNTTLKLANAYTKSYLSYRFDGEPKPFSASFSVTNKCNIHCSYCNYPSVHRSELTLDEIKFIFAKLKKIGVVRLGLLGGEPLFRKDIVDIIDLAKNMGFSISMNTNLLLYDKYKDRLGGVDLFYTSLDGDAEKHNKNRGKQNYNRIISAITSILKTGKKVIAICVVTDPDYVSTEHLLVLAKKEKFQIHFQPECYGAEYSRARQDAKNDNEELRKYWNWMANKKKIGEPIASSLAYLKILSKWDDFTNPVKLIKGTKCAAGRGFLYVDASGMAYTCPYITGNAPSVNLLKEDWSNNCELNTPCTRCIVGPMLEFNLMFEKPVPSLLNAYNNV